MTPAPSLSTKPSRSLSNGRLARSGSSLRLLSAFIASNPEMPSATADASLPPATNASASPNLMIRHASPMALLAVAQALTWQMFGPSRPKSMLTRPLAMLEIIMGIINGETRRGPLVMRILCWASRVDNPPMPLPNMQPKRVGSSLQMSAPESANAIFAAPIIKSV